MAVCFTISGDPVAKGRPRFSMRGGFPRAYTPATTRDYEDVVRSVARKAFKRPLLGPLVLHVDLSMPIPASWSRVKRSQAVQGAIRPTTKPDWDNLGKLISDALNGIAYEDDSQVVECTVVKTYGERPCTRVTLMEA